MVRHFIAGLKRALPRSGGRVDMRPAVLCVLFSIALTASLISLQAGEASITETRVVGVPEAALVARDAGSASIGRQGLSPSLTPQSTTEETASVDGAQLALPETAEGVEAVPVPDEDEPIANEVVATSAVNFGVATTAPRLGSTQPDAATTTQLSRELPTLRVQERPFSSTPATTRPTTSTTTSTTTTTTSTTTTTEAPVEAVLVSGRYSVAQVIDGTIGQGDGSNPNEDGPMGRHDASLFLPQGWDWAQGSTRNAPWGNLRSDQFVEFRCAVIPEFGHTPPVDFRVNFRNGAYYQYASGSWSKAFDVLFDDPSHGAYLGNAGRVNNDPFASSSGAIQWRQEADGSFSAPWNPDALMMHFWASEREAPAAGQIAEFLTSEMRLTQPDGRTVDLSEVRVLFQCGADYYNTTGGQGTSVPGPGIGKYHLLTPDWQSDLWVTLPGGEPADDVADFERWLVENLPPTVGS